MECRFRSSCFLLHSAVRKPLDAGRILINSRIPVGHDHGDLSGAAVHFHHALPVFPPALGYQRVLSLQKQAEADGLRALKEANIDAAVLELKKYEALIKLADGKAAKIIVPSDVVDTATKNVLFSELTEIGNHTEAAAPEPAEPIPDPCCERFESEPELK